MGYVFFYTLFGVCKGTQQEYFGFSSPILTLATGGLRQSRDGGLPQALQENFPELEELEALVFSWDKSKRSGQR